MRNHICRECGGVMHCQHCRPVDRARIAELEAALAVAMTALCSWRSYQEATSDGTTRPSHATAARLYDQCSDAIAACDRLGITPTLSEPDD
jgi:predicted amidohydrolase YtcJ